MVDEDGWLMRMGGWLGLNFRVEQDKDDNSIYFIVYLLNVGGWMVVED